MKTCLSLIVLTALVVTAAVCQSAIPTEPPPVNVAGVSILISRDRLQIRDIQLALAQAHIARLQAEAQIKSLESQLGQTIENLKIAYSCQNCTLNADFTWTKPEPTEAPAEPTAEPAPQKDGPNPKKE